MKELEKLKPSSCPGMFESEVVGRARPRALKKYNYPGLKWVSVARGPLGWWPNLQRAQPGPCDRLVIHDKEISHPDR